MFSVRYELNICILFRRNPVFKGLNPNFIKSLYKIFIYFLIFARQQIHSGRITTTTSHTYLCQAECSYMNNLVVVRYLHFIKVKITKVPRPAFKLATASKS
jgi:hypothetical protein